MTLPSDIEVMVPVSCFSGHPQFGWFVLFWGHTCLCLLGLTTGSGQGAKWGAGDQTQVGHIQHKQAS